MKIEDMMRQAGKGKMSRREFVQMAMVAGSTATIAQKMFVQAARAEPKKGGLFRAAIGHGSTTDSLDPATWNNSFDGDIGQGFLGNMLLTIDQKNRAVPDLSESYESTDDATKWLFRLRKGVTFHNGKSLTAEDVVASYNHHLGKDSTSAAKSILADVAEINIDGPNAVVFTLRRGNADFPYIVTDYHLPILPSKDGRAEWQSGVGTGPFVLERFDPGVRIKGRRNPDYHSESWFDEVEALCVVDVAARTNALVSGEVHYIDRCDLKTLSLLQGDPSLEIDSTTGFAHYVAPMNVTIAPFDNRDVRTALKWAINRQEIVDKILLGHGKAGNDNPIAPSIKFATNPEPVHSYDPEKAKFHLRKAGLSSLKIDLSTSDSAFAGALDAAVLMQSHAKAAGIEINVVQEAADSYGSEVWMKKPWCMSFWLGRPTVDWMMTTAYAADATWNDTFWRHPHFNDLLVQARSETDSTKRAMAYAEMQQILHDDGGVMVLMFNDYVSGHSRKVAHGELNSNYDHDGGKMYRRWWFS